MTTRPHVLLSVAMSVDGCIDDTSGSRLVLSNEADFDQVDEVRARSDAIMIGATTLRRDNPRLLVKSDARRAARVARGEPEYPLKVTITASGNLDPELRFWHHGGDKLVYTARAAAPALRERLRGLAEVVAIGDHPDIAAVLDDLGARGIRRLMVEGGGQELGVELAAWSSTGSRRSATWQSCTTCPPPAGQSARRPDPRGTGRDSATLVPGKTSNHTVGHGHDSVPQPRSGQCAWARDQP